MLVVEDSSLTDISLPREPKIKAKSKRVCSSKKLTKEIQVILTIRMTQTMMTIQARNNNPRSQKKRKEKTLQLRRKRVKKQTKVLPTKEPSTETAPTSSRKKPRKNLLRKRRKKGRKLKNPRKEKKRRKKEKNDPWLNHHLNLIYESTVSYKRIYFIEN